jgi:hypothetical protein
MDEKTSADGPNSQTPGPRTPKPEPFGLAPEQNGAGLQVTENLSPRDFQRTP